MNNPNLITQVSDPIERIENDFMVHLYDSPEMDEIRDQGVERQIFTNAKAIKSTYDRAVEILNEAGQPGAVERLVPKLIPRFGTGHAGLRDEKIGGIPDLRTCLYIKRNDKGRYNISKVWPNCGVCHEPMKFVGQFNLLPWVLPIHAAFGQKHDTYGRGELSLASMFGYGRLSQHTSIYEDQFLHTFACPLSGQHFDNPGFDAHVLVSNKYRRLSSDKIDKAKISAETETAYKASVRQSRAFRRKPDEEYAFKVEARKIEGWDFRVELDEYRLEDWKLEGKFEEVLDSHPDIFAKFGRDFTLLGTPQSQQEPRRFFNNRGQRMTPFVAFNDAEADFSYQIYIDFMMSDGFSYYGKVDGSCT